MLGELFKKKILFFYLQKNWWKMGSKFSKNGKHLYLQKNTHPGLLDSNFVHKPCKFERNRSSGTREILTTAWALAENGHPVKNT